MSDQPAPIIVKRKKIIAGGHHGGAWKVAYADFVTAMMAFFLLMWLLGATTEKQRKGIADYFNPSIPVNKVSGGGDGAFGGDSIFSQSTLTKSGTGAGVTVQSAPTKAKGESGVDVEASQDSAFKETADRELAELKDMLTARGGESMVSDLQRRHIVTRLTDEGLIVEVFEIPGVPLFSDDGTPTEMMVGVASAVADVFRLASNEIAVQGHLSTTPRAVRDNPVWEESAARANRVRALLLDNGIAERRIQRVTGFADRKPVARDLLSVRNNRIEMILLRHRR